MQQEKISLAQLESFLLKSADILRGKMDASEFLIFTAQAGDQGIEVGYANETVWLTQKMMAELFQISVPTSSMSAKSCKTPG